MRFATRRHPAVPNQVTQVPPPQNRTYLHCPDERQTCLPCAEAWRRYPGPMTTVGYTPKWWNWKSGSCTCLGALCGPHLEKNVQGHPKEKAKGKRTIGSVTTAVSPDTSQRDVPIRPKGKGNRGGTAGREAGYKTGRHKKP